MLIIDADRISDKNADKLSLYYLHFYFYLGSSVKSMWGGEYNANKNSHLW